MVGPRVTPAGTHRRQPPARTGGRCQTRPDRRIPTVTYSADRTSRDIESQAREAIGRGRAAAPFAASRSPRIDRFQRPSASHDAGAPTAPKPPQQV